MLEHRPLEVPVSRLSFGTMRVLRTCTALVVRALLLVFAAPGSVTEDDNTAVLVALRQSNAYIADHVYAHHAAECAADCWRRASGGSSSGGRVKIGLEVVLPDVTDDTRKEPVPGG